MSKVRVRFAPSPTGALHIGGVRTALYNYLFAKQNGGSFILRIEDTDQTRFVEGAEEYIIESLKWCGIEPDEGVGFGGEYGPYRQSDRKGMYAQYANQLLESGHAYKAFDTKEELQEARLAAEKDKKTFRYDISTRMSMRNSLSLSSEEVKELEANGIPFVLRLKVPENEEIHFQDMVRGDVKFSSNELDDKVLLKVDGMPTYHMANIVDDHFMEISHVIRGEEWLPSTPTHVLLYRFLGWGDSMPVFCHLPLILKPTKGKLSKRDGAKFGIPVFPLDWEEKDGSIAKGFREWGFLPEAVINFLALLGWNPGTEQEIFDLAGLVQAFDPTNINKSGARYDFAKAEWFNQQYIIATDNEALAAKVAPILAAKGHHPSHEKLVSICALLKERMGILPDFWSKGSYFFEEVKAYDNQKVIRKKWKLDRREAFNGLAAQLNDLEKYDAENLEQLVKKFMADNSLGFGDVLPFLRLATSGSTQGPPVFEIMEVLGKQTVNKRLEQAYSAFDEVIKAKLQQL